MRSIHILVLVCVLCSTHIQAQLIIDAALTPTQLVQNVLLGGGVTASNITFTGSIDARAAFTASGSNLGLDAGVILSSGFATNAAGEGADFASDDNSEGTDADLEALSGQDIFDAAILEFDFIPTGDSLKFRYVFASEEYPEFVCDQFNDAFGFFLSGPGLTGPFSGNSTNIALVPGTSVPITINTVNSGVPAIGNDPLDCAASDPNWEDNSVYYVDNEMGTTVSYDGMTVVMTAIALVQCGQTYHIKLAIGDGFDSQYDSGVFLEAGSFSSTGQVVPQLVTGVGIIGNTMMEGCVPVELIFTRQGEIVDGDTMQIVIGGTATAGVDYSPALPSELIFAPGDSLLNFVLNVPVDPDGPETVVITINQLVACSGNGLTTEFTFNIDSPPPLAVTLDDVDAVCGELNVLEPSVSGGLGYYAYLWSTGEVTPSISVSPSVTTTYTYTISDSCAVQPITGNVTVSLPALDPLEITVSPSIAIPCLESDDIEVLSATGGNGVYTYQWSQGGSSLGATQSINVPAGPPTWYTVEVSEGCGSSIQDSVLVSQAPLPPIAFTTTGDVTVICPGDTATMEVTGISGGNEVYTIEWTNAAGTLLSMEDTLEVGVPVDATYMINVSDQCGGVATEQIGTFLPHYEQMEVFTDPDHLICFGESTVAQVFVQGGSGYFYIDWVGLDWTDPILNITPETTTTYAVNVTDRCGEVLYDEVTVEVESVLIDIAVNNRGQDDWFLQAATIPRAESYVWDWGDGFRSREDEVAHSFTDLEDHWVKLKIVTPNGCAAKDSVFLTPPAHIYFPNAFTPDGDGYNETFGPVSHSIDEFSMVIFNRWGETLYSTEDIYKPWDGTVNGGKLAETGVYVYKYRATGHYFPATEGYGHVTLIKGTQE